jgi:hypothetical protein
MNEIPSWAASLVAIGEKTAATVDGQPLRGLTIALCLPRIDYAAAFVGIGMVKRRFPCNPTASQEGRMKNLLGKWVSFGSGPNAVVGILAWCSVEKTFEIKTKVNKGVTELHEIAPEYWASVRPVGRELNAGRCLSNRQIQKIEEQNSSISTLSRLLGCDLSEPALGRSGSIFSIYGNKTRLNQELSDSLFADEEACLGKVLRPRGHADYEDSFHCAIEGHQSEIPDDEATILIIESGRSLPDQLAASRKFNRVVLLGRNSVNYDECAAQVMEEFTMLQADGPEPDPELPESIRYLAFYHR